MRPQMRGYGKEAREKEEAAARQAAMTPDEADLQVIAALALGMTEDQAGAFVCTVLYPNGITGRTVRNWKNRKPVLYERNIVRIASRWNQAKEEFRQITRDELRVEIEKLRSKAVRVKGKALDHALLNDNDTAALALGNNAATDILDRDLGKATQPHRVDGEMVHTLRIWGSPQPAALLEQQDRDMIDAEDLLKELPGDVMEAEVVQ